MSRDGVARILLKSVQDMLLRVALQTARDDYEIYKERKHRGDELAKAHGKYKGRRQEPKTHERIIVLRESAVTIARTATLARCNISQVTRIWTIYKESFAKSKGNENK